MSFYSRWSISDLHWTFVGRNQNPKPNLISFGSPNPKTMGKIAPVGLETALLPFLHRYSPKISAHFLTLRNQSIFNLIRFIENSDSICIFKYIYYKYIWHG